MEYLASKNWKEYTVKVHALKSTSLLIGAKELSDEALALEMAGKSGDEDYIEKNTAKTMEHLMSLATALSKALPDES